MRYNVIKSEGHLPSLVTDVNIELKRGWKPYGELQVTTNFIMNDREGYMEEFTTFYQVLTIEE